MAVVLNVFLKLSFFQINCVQLSLLKYYEISIRSAAHITKNMSHLDWWMTFTIRHLSQPVVIVTSRSSQLSSFVVGQWSSYTHSRVFSITLFDVLTFFTVNTRFIDLRTLRAFSPWNFHQGQKIHGTRFVTNLQPFITLKCYFTYYGFPLSFLTKVSIDFLQILFSVLS